MQNDAFNRTARKISSPAPPRESRIKHRTRKDFISESQVSNKPFDNAIGQLLSESTSCSANGRRDVRPTRRREKSPEMKMLLRAFQNVSAGGEDCRKKNVEAGPRDADRREYQSPSEMTIQSMSMGELSDDEDDRVHHPKSKRSSGLATGKSSDAKDVSNARIPSAMISKSDPKLKEILSSNDELSNLFGIIIDKSSQLQSAWDVLGKVDQRVKAAMTFCFDHESTEKVENFMELFELFAREYGINEKRLLSHFEDKNYLFEVGINCLKDAGMKEPEKQFAAYLKLKCCEQEEAFCVYKCIGRVLEKGQRPDLNEDYPFKWDCFYELYGHFVDQAGVPDENLMRYCAKRVFEQGIEALRERGVTDPVKRFISFIDDRQYQLKNIWKRAAGIIKQCCEDGQSLFSAVNGGLDQPHGNGKSQDIDGPVRVKKSSQWPTASLHSPRSSITGWTKCTATQRLAHKTSPRQGRKYSPIVAIDDESSREEDMAALEVVLQDLLKEKDEWDYFGKVVSSDLRSIVDEKMRQAAKVHIQQLLFDLRFGSGKIRSKLLL